LNKLSGFRGQFTTGIPGGAPGFEGGAPFRRNGVNPVTNFVRLQQKRKTKRGSKMAEDSGEAVRRNPVKRKGEIF